MSVTPPVSHVVMSPYVTAAAVGSASHAATAVRMVVSSKGGKGVGPGVGKGVGTCVGPGVGKGVGTCVGLGVGNGVGAGVGLGVGNGVGAGVGPGVGAGVGPGVGTGVGLGDGAGVGPGDGEQPPATCVTPHAVDSHGVSVNAKDKPTSSSTHQPRSWSKVEAPSNM